MSPQREDGVEQEPCRKAFTATDFIAESNRIEGIYRKPTPAEVAEHMRFVQLHSVGVRDLEIFVSVYQPGAVLREVKGLDVRVGQHYPPPGGPEIAQSLRDILLWAYSGGYDPYYVHCKYETLHPFTDGNGRSGRALWAWMMHKQKGSCPLGFLHHFYYQALQGSRL